MIFCMTPPEKQDLNFCFSEGVFAVGENRYMILAGFLI